MDTDAVMAGAPGESNPYATPPLTHVPLREKTAEQEAVQGLTTPALEHAATPPQDAMDFTAQEEEEEEPIGPNDFCHVREMIETINNHEPEEQKLNQEQRAFLKKAILIIVLLAKDQTDALTTAHEVLTVMPDRSHLGLAVKLVAHLAAQPQVMNDYKSMQLMADFLREIQKYWMVYFPVNVVCAAFVHPLSPSPSHVPCGRDSADNGTKATDILNPFGNLAHQFHLIALGKFVRHRKHKDQNTDQSMCRLPRRSSRATLLRLRGMLRQHPNVHGHPLQQRLRGRARHRVPRDEADDRAAHAGDLGGHRRRALHDPLRCPLLPPYGPDARLGRRQPLQPGHLRGPRLQAQEVPSDLQQDAVQRSAKRFAME